MTLARREDGPLVSIAELVCYSPRPLAFRRGADSFAFQPGRFPASSSPYELENLACFLDRLKRQDHFPADFC